MEENRMGVRKGHLGTDHGAHHLLPGWGKHPDSYVEAPDVLGPAHSQGSRAKALIGTGNQGDVWYDPDLPEGHLPNGHMTITGESGSGKTQAMKTILADLSAAGVPALVLDFKDDYAEKKYAATEGFKVYDPARSPLPFNPLEAPLDPETGLRNKVFHTYQLVEILARIYHLGELQEQTLRSAMKQAYDDAGEGTPTFDNVRAKLDTKTEKGRSENAELLSHLAPIFDFGFFSEANPVGFNHIATGNTVIRLAQLPGNEVKNSVAEFFLMALYNHLVALPQTHLLRQVLVLDEAWRVVNSPFLEPLMREARAFGLGIFVATQFPTDLPLAVQGSAATQVYLSQSNPDQVEEIARAVVGDTRSSEAMRLETTVRSLLPLQAIVHNRQYEPWTQCDARPYYARATLKAAKTASEIDTIYHKLAGEPSGWRECNECGGEGCLACKQSGLGPSSGGPTEPCYMCEGKGYKYGDTPCEHCKATGVINYKYDVGDHAILRLHDPREAIPVRVVSRDFGTPGGRPIGPSYEVETASLSAGGWSPHYRCHEYHLTPKTKRNEHWFAGPPKTAQEVMPPDDGDHICPRCQVGTINADGTCSSCKGLVNDFVKADDQSLSDRVDAVTGPWKSSKTDAFEPCSACDGSGVRGRVEGIGWPPCRGCGKSSGFHAYPFARETLECNSCAHLDQVKDIAADYNALPEIRCPACKGSGLAKTAELQKFPPGEDDDSPFAPFSTSEWQMVKGPKKRTQTAARNWKPGNPEYDAADWDNPASDNEGKYRFSTHPGHNEWDDDAVAEWSFDEKGQDPEDPKTPKFQCTHCGMIVPGPADAKECPNCEQPWDDKNVAKCVVHGDSLWDANSYPQRCNIGESLSNGGTLPNDKIMSCPNKHKATAEDEALVRKYRDKLPGDLQDLGAFTDGYGKVHDGLETALKAAVRAKGRFVDNPSNCNTCGGKGWLRDPSNPPIPKEWMQPCRFQDEDLSEAAKFTKGQGELRIPQAVDRQPHKVRNDPKLSAPKKLKTWHNSWGFDEYEGQGGRQKGQSEKDTKDLNVPLHVKLMHQDADGDEKKDLLDESHPYSHESDEGTPGHEHCTECGKPIRESIDVGYCEQCNEDDWDQRPTCARHNSKLWDWNTIPRRCNIAEDLEQLPLGHQGPCPSCEGTGNPQNEHYNMCPTCSGSGILSINKTNHGRSSMSQGCWFPDED